MPHAITEQDISYKGVDMLWISYALISVFFFILLLTFKKVKRKTDPVSVLALVATGCSFVVFMLLYVPLQVYASKVTDLAVIKLAPLSCSSQTPVYVIAFTASGDGDTKRDAYIVNLNHDNFPTQGIFTEGEARLSFESRSDAIIEKSSTRLVGKALWFTTNQPRVEYVIRVPKASMERPARMKEFW